jgi:3-methyladenine DNA glycosylase AlkC
LRTLPLPVARTAGARPEAFALARWQAKMREGVTSLRHETIRLPDPFARTLLTLLDGTRDRTEIVRTLASGSSPAETGSIAQRVDDTLNTLAQFGLLLR